MRCAIYARYSTDRQNEASIQDQINTARRYAEAQGWLVVATHSDSEQSGATPVALRPGGKALLADLMARRFDILVVEDLSRLSRQLAETESLIQRLETRGVRVVGISDSYDSRTRGRKMMRIVRGMMNEFYLDDVRDKTHRGLVGNMSRGMSAGGRTYGYRSQATPIGHQLLIDENEAQHVRWVFRMIVEGHSPRYLVEQLNRQGVPSARGGTWAVSAIVGSAQKGLGMLHNQLYIGRHVWNRSVWVKDPDTGKRLRRDRPQTEWIVRHDESLRIIDQDLWDRVQARVAGGKARGIAPGKGASPKTLFGGLMRCGACGGPYIAVNPRRYGCGVRKDRGPSVCSNSTTLAREQFDARMITHVRDELAQPYLMATVRDELQALIAAHGRAAGTSTADLKARAAELSEQIQKLVAAITAVGISPALATALQAAESEKSVIEASLQTRSKGPSLDSAIADVEARYKRLLMRLENELSQEDRSTVRDLLAQLLGTITIRPENDGAVAEFEEPAERLLRAVAGESLGLVAGACNSTQRLRRIFFPVKARF